MNFAEVIIIENLNNNSAKPAIGFKKKEEWKELSWSKFSKLIKKTGNALKNAGIKENDKVAIYCDNSAEWITFYLATISIGAITVPIDSKNNTGSTEFIIQKSESKIVLVGNQNQYDACFGMLNKNSLLEKIIVAKKAVWIKKEKSEYLEDFIAQASEELDFVSRKDEDVAENIFVYEADGMLKKSTLSHGDYRCSIDIYSEFIKGNKNLENEVSLTSLPLSHVFGRCWAIFCLYSGAKVFFIESSENIEETIAKLKPTIMYVTPIFLCQFYENVINSINAGSSTRKKIFNWAIKRGNEKSELQKKGLSVPLDLKFKNNIANGLVFNRLKQKLGGKLWFISYNGIPISKEIIHFFEVMGVMVANLEMENENTLKTLENKLKQV